MKSLVFWFLLVTVSLTACENSSYEGQGETQKAEASFTETQQGRLIKAVPPPSLEYSLERESLKRRLVRFNDPNKVSYIYLVNHGMIMGFFPIKGKVSSVNSKLTTGEQIVHDPYRYQSGGKVVESPQLDGSYGTNGAAIFFFTTEDVYVEWSGDYVLLDQPLQLSQPVQMIYDVKVSE